MWKLLIPGAGLLAFWAAWMWERKAESELPKAETQRWFLPGELGAEYGGIYARPTQQAYLTRYIGGIGKREGETGWYGFNQLGRPLNFMHNLDRIVRREDYEAHPEWFPLVDGKRLNPEPRQTYWQPDIATDAVAARAAELAVEALQNPKAADATGRSSAPKERSFAIGINDALIYGESPELLKKVLPQRYFRGKPDYSNLIFDFGNRVAKRVEASLGEEPENEWWIGCLAYYWCEQVPDFRIHPRLVPYLCSDRSQGYDSAFWKEEFELQEAWGRSGVRRLGLYDYLDGWGYLVPRLHTRLLAENLKHARASGFTDYYGEACPHWGLDGPQHWLVAQLLADPAADWRSLVDEYYRRYFREAAAPMRAFFERCEALWMEQKGPVDWLRLYRNEAQAELFPSAVCGELRKLLLQAQHEARTDVVRRRVDLVSMAFGATERLARQWEAKKRVTAFAEECESGRGNWLELEKALGELDAAETELPRYLNAVAKSQPLALYPGWPPEIAPSAPLFNRTSPASAARALLARKGSSAPRGTVLEGGFLSFEGTARPGRRIAGLQYGADLPMGWNGKLEPSEGLIAKTMPEAARSGGAGLRLSNAKYGSIFLAVPVVEAAKEYEAEVYVRGRISPAARVSLSVYFLNKDNAVMQGPLSMRYIPVDAHGRYDTAAGDCWHRLAVVRDVPVGAKAVGVNLAVAYMLPGDSVDFDDVRLVGR